MCQKVTVLGAISRVASPKGVKKGAKRRVLARELSQCHYHFGGEYLAIGLFMHLEGCKKYYNAVYSRFGKQLPPTPPPQIRCCKSSDFQGCFNRSQFEVFFFLFC
jgi:hypothetical protein